MKKLLMFPAIIFSFLFAQAQHPVPRPKLVVGLVVDQMRWDYLYRYYARYGSDGFRRLLNDGFSCENTTIPYSKTVTATGHASIYTGSIPAIHGIVANDWIEKETESFMYCTRDLSVQPVGTTSSSAQMSPANLLTNTVGDELRLASNFRGKVIGLALKDRGSILSAGHLANASYWFDDTTGNWVTSTYYMKTLPDWVKSYNQKRIPDQLMRQDWTLLYDQSTYINSTADNKSYEKVIESDSSRTFPHSYKNIIGGKNYYAFRVSPYGNFFTLDFASTVIRNEKLGQRGETDMLCISLSSTDYLGHRFGPNSLEMEDCYLRLDRDIAAFLKTLDSTYGKNNYLLFLTSDHGSPNIAAFLHENGYKVGTLDANQIVKELNMDCERKFGYKELVSKIYDYDLYINKKRTDSLGLNRVALTDFIVDWLKSKKEIVTAYSTLSLQNVILPAVLKEKITNNYYHRRSGDVQFIMKAQYTDFTPTGLEHGAWYRYDSHIPLVFYGWGIQKGKTHREVWLTDIAPTLSSLLRIQEPNGTVGKPIGEVVK